ncbi:hypothetical protein LTR97_012897 [Elasticomyces elasticus]|uniref:Uncharacterized protein n=1 Tax=Elasticomyces elasticus TaxID=574655 RepID=A0AAN7VKJ0_9PEZI|nr:hypothetical protein LTR97_012897 [Elasticomyces elasticus]
MAAFVHSYNARSTASLTKRAAVADGAVSPGHGAEGKIVSVSEDEAYEDGYESCSELDITLSESQQDPTAAEQVSATAVGDNASSDFERGNDVTVEGGYSRFPEFHEKDYFRAANSTPAPALHGVMRNTTSDFGDDQFDFDRDHAEVLTRLSVDHSIVRLISNSRPSLRSDDLRKAMDGLIELKVRVDKLEITHLHIRVRIGLTVRITANALFGQATNYIKSMARGHQHFSLSELNFHSLIATICRVTLSEPQCGGIQGRVEYDTDGSASLTSIGNVSFDWTKPKQGLIVEDVTAEILLKLMEVDTHLLMDSDDESKAENAHDDSWSEDESCNGDESDDESEDESADESADDSEDYDDDGNGEEEMDHEVESESQYESVAEQNDGTDDEETSEGEDWNRTMETMSAILRSTVELDDAAKMLVMVHKRKAIDCEPGSKTKMARML